MNWRHKTPLIYRHRAVVLPGTTRSVAGASPASAEAITRPNSSCRLWARRACIVSTLGVLTGVIPAPAQLGRKTDPFRTAQWRTASTELMEEAAQRVEKKRSKLGSSSTPPRAAPARSTQYEEDQRHLDVCLDSAPPIGTCGLARIGYASARSPPEGSDQTGGWSPPRC